MVNDDFFSIRTGRTTPTKGVRPTFVTPNTTVLYAYLLRKIFPSVCLPRITPGGRCTSVVRHTRRGVDRSTLPGSVVVVPWWSRDGGESLVLVGGLLVVVGGENDPKSISLAIRCGLQQHHTQGHTFLLHTRTSILRREHCATIEKQESE